MKRAVLLLVAAMLTLGLLASCAWWESLFGGGDGGITISGTIRPNSDVTITSAGRLIVGLTDYVPLAGASTATWVEGIQDNPLSKTPGSAVAYQFTNVPEGRYVVVAWVDVNNSGTWEMGEPSGMFPAYTTTVEPRDFQSDYTGADVTLYSYRTSTENISISGTITKDSGVTVTGGDLIVGIIDYIPQATDTSVTWTDAVAGNPQHLTPAGSVSYTVDDVPPDSYMVMTWIDLDGDETWDTNEPSGCFPQWTASGGSLYPFQIDFDAADIVLFIQGEGAPTAPALVNPGNGATTGSVDVTLSWDASTDPESDPLTYDVYVEIVPNLVTPLAEGLTVTTYDLLALDAGATYYWKVVARDNQGNASQSDTWYFIAGSGVSHLYAEDFSGVSTSTLEGEGWLVGLLNTGTVEVVDDPAYSGRGSVLHVVDANQTSGEGGTVAYSPYVEALTSENLTTNANAVAITFDVYFGGTEGRWFLLGKTHAETFVMNDPSSSIAAYWAPFWDYISIIRGRWYSLKFYLNETAGSYDVYLYDNGVLVDSMDNVGFNPENYEGTHLGADGDGEGRLMFGSWFNYPGCPDSSYGDIYVDNIVVDYP